MSTFFLLSYNVEVKMRFHVKIMFCTNREKKITAYKMKINAATDITTTSSQRKVRERINHQ